MDVAGPFSEHDDTARSERRAEELRRALADIDAESADVREPPVVEAKSDVSPPQEKTIAVRLADSEHWTWDLPWTRDQTAFVIVWGGFLALIAVTAAAEWLFLAVALMIVFVSLNAVVFTLYMRGRRDGWAQEARERREQAAVSARAQVAALTPSEDRGDGASVEGRDVTFVIPCPLCGYRTSVTVTIDWGGRILSGNDVDHEFRCSGCGRVFTVPKASLTPYTNGFV